MKKLLSFMILACGVAILFNACGIVQDSQVSHIDSSAVSKAQNTKYTKKYHPTSRDELIELINDESIYLGDIDTSKITNMYDIFASSQREDFSGIELWDTSNVENMSFMFANMESFNHDISAWDTSKVKDMMGMFWYAESFNQPLNSWNVSNVENMVYMFQGAERFNQPLDKWNVSNVKYMIKMFYGARKFKQNLNSWNVSNIKDDFYKEFLNASFDMWGLNGMFYESPLENNPPKWYKDIINKE